MNRPSGRHVPGIDLERMNQRLDELEGTSGRECPWWESTMNTTPPLA